MINKLTLLNFTAFNQVDTPVSQPIQLPESNKPSLLESQKSLVNGIAAKKAEEPDTKEEKEAKVQTTQTVIDILA